MKCEFGYCLVCEKEIAPKCGSCEARRPGGQYTEVQLNWSNGSRMNVAVCLDCSKDKVWVADKVAMTQAHFDAWDKCAGQYDREVVIV